MARKRNYEVGYGKPPRKTRFRKGQSGNPAGRPKHVRNFKTDITEEMSAMITVREGGVEKRVTRQRAFIKRVANGALEGDARSARILTELITRAGGFDEAEIAAIQIDADDQVIVDLFEAQFADLAKVSKPRKPRKGKSNAKPKK